MIKSQAIRAYSEIVHSQLSISSPTVLAIGAQIKTIARFPSSQLSVPDSVERQRLQQILGGSDLTSKSPALLEKSVNGGETVILARRVWLLMRRTDEAVEMWIRPQDGESHFDFQNPEGSYFQVVNHATQWQSVGCEISAIALQDWARVAVYAKGLVMADSTADIVYDQQLVVTEVLDVQCSLRTGCSSSRPEHLVVSGLHLNHAINLAA